MAGPVGALETAIFNTLNVASVKSGAGATGVYNKIAPQGAVLPYVIFQWQGGGDDNSTPKRGRSPTYTVKAVAETVAAAEAIDAACDALLHMQTLTVTGWTNYWSARDEDVNYPEVDTSGRLLFHIGGMYKIRISK